MNIEEKREVDRVRRQVSRLLGKRYQLDKSDLHGTSFVGSWKHEEKDWKIRIFYQQKGQNRWYTLEFLHTEQNPDWYSFRKDEVSEMLELIRSEKINKTAYQGKKFTDPISKLFIFYFILSLFTIFIIITGIKKLVNILKS